jgi:Tryptophan halogenase
MKRLRAAAAKPILALHATESAPKRHESVPMTRKIAVLGAGSAGLLTAAHLCTWLDNSWQIVTIYDPNKKTLGIGESTNGAFISVLERATNFSIAHADDLAALDATIKYGSKFVNWRPQTWVNPLLSGNIAIHFNNHRFTDFVLNRLRELWPQQFNVVEANVRETENYADHIRVHTDQGSQDFDYVVDCTGTPSGFEGYTLSDCTLIDRCRIHTVKDYVYEPFTDHIATRDGWMFGVPLKGYKTYGYLYNHALTDTQAAEAEMMRLLGTNQLDAGGYEAHYAFRCYYANQLISGRLCKNGNKALFFEPLLANSMFLYIYAARLIYDHVVGGQEASHCNTRFVKAVQEVEDVISYYYQGGSTLDTEFWRASAARASARLGKRTELSNYFAKLRELKQRGVMLGAPPYAFSPNTWQLVDQQMGYGSLKVPPTPQAP